MKNLKTLAALVVALLCSITSNAQTLVDGIYYYFYYDEWDSNAKATASVTHDGTGYYNCYSGAVVIPEIVTYDGRTYTVNEIGNGAFRSCSNLTSVNLPANISSIEDYCFYDCRNLKSITIPDAVKSIGYSAFSDCYSLEEVTLPEGLLSIREYAFSGCGITLNIPSSVTTIGNWAFNNATLYISATNPSWLTINENHDPFGYSTIVVPDDAYNAYTTSANWARYSSNIRAASEMIRYEHTDANGVTWNYRYVYASNSLSIINATGYTTNLVFPATLPYGEGSLSVGGVEFGISNNDVITSVDLSATSIKRITRYGYAMGVSNVYFDNCPSLQSVILPSSLEEIGYNAFCNCPSIETINWSNLTSLKTIASGSFYSEWDKKYALLTNIDLSATKVETIGDNAFENIRALESIKFPSTLKRIGNYAFQYQSNLNNIDLSNTQVTELGNNVFESCSNLQSVSLPTCLKKIGSRTFAGASSSLQINLSNVEIIGDNAFKDRYLYEVDLSSATSIGLNAFTSDLVVTINSSTPANIKPNSFTKGTRFYVTTDAYDTFCTTLIWSNWANNISMFNIDADGVKWMYRYLSDTESMCITSASGYGQNVTVPNYVSYKNSNVPVTHLENAFNGANISSITLPTTLTNIGNNAFSSTKLQSIEIPASVTSIGDYAFYYCKNLVSVTFAPNSALQTIGNYAFASNEYTYEDGSESQLTSIELPASVTSIGDGAFQYCRKLNTVTFEANSQLEAIGSNAFRGCYKITEFDLSKVKTIGSYAFYGVNLASIDLSSATAVGNNAFSGGDAGEPFFTINNTTPATIESKAFPTNSIFLVPGTSVNTYRTANIWSNYASRILASEVAIRSLNVTADASRSDIQVQIGDTDLPSVVDLTLKGTINSYDFIVLRNKMPLLRRLDLSEAHIVGNSYPHYEYYCTEDNKFPAYGLYNCKLVSLELPQSITEIGYYAFRNNPFTEIVIPDSVTSIRDNAFSSCNKLKNILLPDGLTSFASNVFSSCSNLKTINIPRGVTTIPSGAFQSCSSLESIVLPPTIESIGWGAFRGCYGLKELRIPSSVRRIENDAFSGTNISDIYVYVVEPFDINQQTFAMTGNNFIGTLHAPKVSYWSYYYNTQWSQFLNFAEFDEPYENFYLEGDKVLDEETGSIRGEEDKDPDADLGSNSGLVLEDDVTQDLGDVEINHDGQGGGSVIVDGSGEVNAEKLTFRINVQGGRWYFFCFPFDVRKDDVVLENGAEWIFRYYDGEERAKKGQGGWKNVTSDGNGNFLKAATGYIFQCSKNDVLVLSAKNAKIKKEDKYNELVEHITQNTHDASWNFVGNPYLSYYEITSNDYSAPITVWDGNNYIAVRPGDDDYQLAPFEAFFVQKPNGTDAINYDSENQMTRKEAAEVAAAARLARSRQAINPNRLLVNITLSNGKQTDKTRVVFNNEADMKYEAECDAAKFSVTDVPQLYTLDAKAVKYAINERPVAQGNVTLGYTAPVEGQYVLEAPRMDTPMLLIDNVTGTVHDFTDGAYEFNTEAGSYDARFTLIINGNATGINGVEGTESDGPIYNIKGQQVKDMKENGVYIKNSRKIISK